MSLFPVAKFWERFGSSDAGDFKLDSHLRYKCGAIDGKHIRIQSHRN